MFQWLRRLIRTNSRRIPQSTAEKWDLRLSLMYGFLTWNAAGFILYMAFSDRGDIPEVYGSKKTDQRQPSERFADILGIKKAHVIQLSGFKKVGEFDIDNTSAQGNTSTEEK